MLLSDYKNAGSFFGDNDVFHLVHDNGFFRSEPDEGRESVDPKIIGGVV